MDTSPAPVAAAAAAATPVIVSQGSAGAPKVVRGFDVVDRDGKLG
ncbi:hypothetical protein E2C01_100386 [Portunus trituberculatus]|uniref:Uncharacterized protein n=1 Tax=Portunus trituberculatus TaxID=210409 RepID=A0A5B7KD77_PORTR|nr:hypothetical protein [Portunus trituberculatus]